MKTAKAESAPTKVNMAAFRGEKAAAALAMKHTFGKVAFSKPLGGGSMRGLWWEFFPFFQIKSDAYF